jgi:hypothetical protein
VSAPNADHVALPTLVWCVACGQEWEIDNQPMACVCEDGGFWRISVDGGVWIDQNDGSVTP